MKRLIVFVLSALVAAGLSTCADSTSKAVIEAPATGAMPDRSAYSQEDVDRARTFLRDHTSDARPHTRWRRAVVVAVSAQRGHWVALVVWSPLRSWPTVQTVEAESQDTDALALLVHSGDYLRFHGPPQRDATREDWTIWMVKDVNVIATGALTS